MSNANPTGLIKDIIKDFEYLITNIESPISKTYLIPAMKSNLSSMNKDIPREITDSLIDLIYLTDHV